MIDLYGIINCLIICMCCLFLSVIIFLEIIVFFIVVGYDGYSWDLMRLCIESLELL